jgi:hypothetical protein
MRKIFCALPAKRCSISKLGGKAASVCQRVEDNAFHLRTLSERWIGFSEDDAKTNRRRHKIYSDIAVERLAWRE